MKERKLRHWASIAACLVSAMLTQSALAACHSGGAGEADAGASVESGSSDGLAMPGGAIESEMQQLTPSEWIEGQLDHYASAYERFAAIPAAPLDDAEVRAMVGYFAADDSYYSIKVLIAHVADEALRESIIEECGQDDLDAYAKADLLGEADGFKDYVAALLGDDYVEGHADEIAAALADRGIS